MRPETCRQIFANIWYYYRDEEIIAFLDNDERLHETYQSMKVTSQTAVYPFIARAKEQGTIDLHVIVKYDQPDETGQWDYYYAPNYLGNTDFKEWLKEMGIATGITAEEFFENILEKTEEAKEALMLEELTFSATDNGEWVIF